MYLSPADLLFSPSSFFSLVISLSLYHLLAWLLREDEVKVVSVLPWDTIAMIVRWWFHSRAKDVKVEKSRRWGLNSTIKPTSFTWAFCMCVGFWHISWMKLSPTTYLHTTKWKKPCRSKLVFASFWRLKEKDSRLQPQQHMEHCDNDDFRDTSKLSSFSRSAGRDEERARNMCSQSKVCFVKNKEQYLLHEVAYYSPSLTFFVDCLGLRSWVGHFLGSRAEKKVCRFNRNILRKVCHFVNIWKYEMDAFMYAPGGD